jgi:hypothetical protein
MADDPDYLLRPDPHDPRLTERVRGIDHTGAPIETSVTVERENRRTEQQKRRTQCRIQVS